MSLQKRRILYIQAPPGGGSVISLYELVRGLDIRRFVPIVLFYKESVYCKQFVALGAEVITLPGQSSCHPTAQNPLSTRTRRHAAWLRHGRHVIKPIYQVARQDWAQVHRIIRVIRAKAIDLVHHNNNLPVNRAAVIAACLTNTPQICHVRWFNNLSFIDKWLARWVNAFIYNSRSVEACYHSQGIMPHKGQVVYNPINMEVFAQAIDTTAVRAEFGLTMRDKVISNIGRLDCWKGQDYFLESLPELIQVEPDVKALIVGGTNSELEEHQYYLRLRRLVTDLNLSDHVVFAGFRTDIPQIMAASDIVVHSASEPEPFGRVVVEAMAASRPVIATAAGGVLEIIQDQVNGFLVPPKRPVAMAKAILHLLRNPEQACLVGQRAQRYVTQRFSIDQHVTAIEQIYQHVLTK
jgi:glycosyltransferase involved in cell wall biosynthesis